MADRFPTFRYFDVQTTFALSSAALGRKLTADSR
jgi:hypothetical protein